MITYRQLFLRHLGQTSPSPLLLEIEKAEGSWLYGPDGKKYLDLISGVSVSNIGHRHPRVIEAIKTQIDSYLHLMVYGELVLSPQVLLAKKLASLLPEKLNCCYFVNSGSEAVEGALKLARRYTGKSRIVYFRNSYHGSTHGAMSVQGSEIFRNAFRPLIPDTYQLGFNDEESLNEIDTKTACVIIEPVQAEAGVVFPQNEFLGKVRKKCNETGALLIFDEIQTGFGRLGHLFAIDRFKIVPDILLLAKALGGGMPLGAFIASSEIMSSLSSNPVLGHITTFGGHPVCCAAGLASLDVLLDEKLIENCRSRADSFREKLIHPAIKNVRGEGLLLAVQLADENHVRKMVDRASEYGLILDYFLFCNDAFRIAPPLNISEEETEFACLKINALLDSIVGIK